MPGPSRDVGSRIKSGFGAYSTAAGSTVSGAWIDRFQGSPKAIPLSAKLVITWSATLATSETLTISANYRDATDSSGTGAAAVGSAYAAAVVATGTTAASLLTGTTELNLDASQAREFLQSQHKLAVSASGTVAHTSTLLFAGFDKLS